jgi:hypothetical protein
MLGSLAILAAMRRASSRVRRFPAERRSRAPPRNSVSERLPLASRTMKHRLSSLESDSSTDQGGGKWRSGRA